MTYYLCCDIFVSDSVVDLRAEKCVRNNQTRLSETDRVQLQDSLVSETQSEPVSSVRIKIYSHFIYCTETYKHSGDFDVKV